MNERMNMLFFKEQEVEFEWFCMIGIIYEEYSFIESFGSEGS